jgi:small subunit ribosomal protein S17
MSDETPDTPAEDVQDAAPAGGEDEPTAAAPEAAQAAAVEPADETPAAPAAQTRRERLESRRADRRAAIAGRGPRTNEERDAERREARAVNAKQRRAYRAKQKAKRAEASAAAPAREELHAPEHGPGRPKVRQGIVVSAKPDKTITVRIDDARRHRRYRKIMRTSTTLHVHDERNEAHEGDTVRVVECRPMSRTKRWRLTDVLERAR